MTDREFFELFVSDGNFYSIYIPEFGSIFKFETKIDQLRFFEFQFLNANFNFMIL